MPTRRAAFAASGTAGGLVSNGISFFLLVYYHQVIGLDPALASSALLLALVVDAVTDPLIGRWSDRLRSRLGRRHPFLYASIVPVALCYCLLWTPPDLTPWATFLWLTGFTVALRVSLTLHTVPFNALLPELSDGYDERTRLMNHSQAAGWFFGTLMAVAMYRWWLADTPEYPDGSGILRRAGYEEAGLVTAVGICLALTAAAVLTHRASATSRPPPVDKGSEPALHQMLVTLGDRDLAAIVVSTSLSAAATGTSTAMWVYMQPWFWRFGSDQSLVILAAQLVSPLIGIAVLPLASRGRDKKTVLIRLSLLALLAGSGPVVLALLGAFPPVGHPARFALMAAVGVIQVALIVMIGALSGSMIADIVDARALVTGRREEGLVTSVLSFTGKVATGLGVWTGGLLLKAVRFPTNDLNAADVDPQTIERLGWLYGPVLATFYLAAIWALRHYRLSRRRHEANLATLEARKS